MEAALAGFAGPLATIDFDHLGADWEGEMNTLYRALDMKLSPEALAAMRNEMRKSERGAHTSHAAQLRDFKGAA